MYGWSRILDFHHPSPARFSFWEVFLIFTYSTSPLNQNPRSHPLSITHIVFQEDWQLYSNVILNSSIYHHLSIAFCLAQAKPVFQQIKYAFRISHEYLYVILSPSPLLCHKTKPPSSLPDYLLPHTCSFPPMQYIFHTAAVTGLFKA